MAERSRWFFFVLYPESQQTIIDFCRKSLPCAMCLHDSDFNKETGELKKEHFHVLVHLDNAKTNSAFTKMLNGVSEDVKFTENMLEYIHSPYGAFHYLWHDTDNSRDKFQYSEDDVEICNGFIEPKQNEGIPVEVEAALLFEVDKTQFHSVEDFGRWAYANGCWAEFRKSYMFWRDVFRDSRVLANCTTADS